MQWHFKQVLLNKRKGPSLFVLIQTIDAKDILLRCVTGQERQFSPGFEKREDLRETVFSTRQGEFKLETKAYIMTTDTPDKGKKQVFAYILTDQKNFKVLATPTFSVNIPYNNLNPCRYNKTIMQENALKRVQVANTWSKENPIIFCTQFENTPDILIFINFGATNHCFTNRLLFVSYTTLSELYFRISAKKNSTFDIIEKEKIEFKTSVNRKTRRVSINGILYTPNLRSNLISVSQLGTKGVDMFFKGENKALVLTSEGEIIMTIAKFG